MLFPSPVVAIVDRAFSPLANINYIPKEAEKQWRAKLVPQKSTGRGHFCWENLKPAIQVIQTQRQLQCGPFKKGKKKSMEHLCITPQTMARGE